MGGGGGGGGCSGSFGGSLNTTEQPRNASPIRLGQESNRFNLTSVVIGKQIHTRTGTCNNFVATFQNCGSGCACRCSGSSVRRAGGG